MKVHLRQMEKPPQIPIMPTCEVVCISSGSEIEEDAHAIALVESLCYVREVVRLDCETHDAAQLNLLASTPLLDEHIADGVREFVRIYNFPSGLRVPVEDSDTCKPFQSIRRILDDDGFGLRGYDLDGLLNSRIESAIMKYNCDHAAALEKARAEKFMQRLRPMLSRMNFADPIQS
jgi:hypothetical protein